MAKDDDSGNEVPQDDVGAASAGDGSGSGDPPAAEAQGDGLLSQADIDAAMAEGIEDEAPAPGADTSQPRPAEMVDFNGPNAANDSEREIDLLDDVELDVKIELGRSRMMVEDVLNLSNGSVVELDKLAGDPVDVLVNDRLVARGEVLVLNDNFCVRVNEIITQSGEAIRS